MAPPKLKGLGRGLDALLAGNSGEAGSAGELRTLEVGVLQPGKYQPRTRMDPGSLEELAESIKSQGIMQPILVREIARGSFEIIAGERRWRAAQIAGLTEVPALVREIADEAALAMSLIENIQREDLNPLEEAAGVQRLIDEFGMTHEQAANAIGRSRSATTNLLRLLQLAEPVQEQLIAGDLDMGHARALLTLPRGDQIALANRVVAQGLTVRDTEKLVAQGGVAEQGGRKAAPVSRDLAGLEEELSDRLGAAVSVQANARGAGKVVLRFNDLDQLDGLIARLRV
ncbi:MAG: ParB/RepB/Spo0J family partition protein [Gammaproteobacteria bacterium]|jgi:ParB family transcriptional regulator, chromosome partitioning protein|nr:ParB/RepB/Spo0J family partition protein [Gammaproteobacteria bacterium]MBU0772319.1 ParB/RepB/Spo0J family partition protein [Gammaproteobacteria bacterium]MBU0857930.1 ParB/RepB/Spo0J family partition protein [Gammaproteobacteria bacterium]MBU1848446.1 ParB/RepB/Spo0J family partition protein [Gammaproteobacteria bacterium]